MSERATVHLIPGSIVDLVVDVGAGTRLTYSATITLIDTDVICEYVRVSIESNRPPVISRTPDTEDA